MSSYSISFYDLDSTLWKLGGDVNIIDKEKPWKSVLKIDSSEFVLINNGYYRKDDLKLDYNGKTFYISKSMFNKICKISKTENIERFGISFMSFVDKDLLNSSEVQFLIQNIIHLKDNKYMEVGLLTGRSNQKTHSDILNKLRLELKGLGIEISKIYFVSDRFDPKTSDEMSIKKVYILLEHLIGFKIDVNKFTDEKQDWYQSVTFYDDDIKNIEYAHEIQDFFNELMRNTEDNVHRNIMDRIKNYKLKLIVNQVTSNEYNRFKTKEIELRQPYRYPIFVEKMNHKL